MRKPDKQQECPKCNKSIGLRNFNNHLIACDGTCPIKINYEQWLNDDDIYHCPFCNKNMISSRAFKSHIWRRHSIKGILHKPLCPPDKHISWNRGLTKETDERVAKNGESVSKTMKKQVKDATYKPRVMGIVARKRLSERQSLHNSGGKSKWFEVNGIKVQGTYEKLFAEALTEQNIIWQKPKVNTDLFKYSVENNIRSYAPDFYLEEFNLYIEIKGYWWGNDEEKMKIIREQHQDKKLVVLFGLVKLEEICKNIKNNLPKEPLWSW